MLHVQEYLKNHTLEDLHEEFGVRAKVYDDRVTLKYSITSNQKTHPIVKECRGLILSLPDYKVVSRPFDRFFNLGESPEEVKDFNWNECQITFKHDGSLIHVYHYNGEWGCATSGTAFAEGQTPLSNKTYKDLFEEAIGGKVNDVFKNYPKEYTYIFELVSPENRIVTPYTETKVYILGIRHKETGLYANLMLMLDLMKHNGYYFAHHPKTFNFNDPESIKNYVENMDQMDEGVVCYDPVTQKRIKIKSSTYVSLHHIRGNEVTKKSVITLILKNEVDEFVTYFPEYKKIIQPYVDSYEGMLYYITQYYDTFKDIKDQKEFALKVKDDKYSGVYFQLRKGKKLKDIFCLDNLNYVLKLF